NKLRVEGDHFDARQSGRIFGQLPGGGYLFVGHREIRQTSEQFTLMVGRSRRRENRKSGQEWTAIAREPTVFDMAETWLRPNLRALYAGMVPTAALAVIGLVIALGPGNIA